MLKNTIHSYGKVARLLHWLCAIAVITALACIELKGYFPKGDPWRGNLQMAHIQAGIMVFWLVIPRFIWRTANRSPLITPSPAPLIMKVADLTHWVLYALMFCMPILGVAFIQGFGKPVDFFGWILPTMFSMTPETAKDVKDVHEFLGNTLLWLVILHVGAGLWHQRIIKDDTMSRMIGPIRNDDSSLL